jgi:hypothetical protein
MAILFPGYYPQRQRLDQIYSLMDFTSLNSLTYILPIYWEENIHFGLKGYSFMRRFNILTLLILFLFPLLFPNASEAWFDETHVAVAKVAGYSKWFNAVGPDMIKEKMGNREGHNPFVNNPRGTIITPEMVIAQAEKYTKLTILAPL